MFVKYRPYMQVTRGASIEDNCTKQKNELGEFCISWMTQLSMSSLD